MTQNLLQIPAGEFKAKCLQVMDEVNENHVRFIITKRGVPVAQLIPIDEDKPIDIFGCMQGTVTLNDDIIHPIDEMWDADKNG